jgi:Na+/proline symporter
MTGSALAALFFLGIFSRRATGAGAVIGALVTAGVLAYIKLKTQMHGLTYAIVGFLCCVTTGWLASLALPANRKPINGLTLHTMKREEY